MKKQKERFIHCPECGLEYVVPIDMNRHKIYHQRYLDCQDEFGKLPFFPEREQLKHEAGAILTNERSSLTEKVEAVEQMFLAFFGRSVQFSRFDLNHPSYSEYSSMLLSQLFWTDFLKPYAGVYEALVEKYGCTAVIPNGKTIFRLKRGKAKKVLIDGIELARGCLLKKDGT